LISTIPKHTESVLLTDKMNEILRGRHKGC
jgi:hypothetical protein